MAGSFWHREMVGHSVRRGTFHGVELNSSRFRYDGATADSSVHDRRACDWPGSLHIEPVRPTGRPTDAARDFRGKRACFT
jgi:hypothetical protein